MTEAISSIFYNITAEAGIYRKRFSLRHGQAIYNIAHKYFPNFVDTLTATEFDCFYDDSKVDSFLAKLEQMLK